MKIVGLFGGLANQMFQYIFYKYLTAHSEDCCYLDDSFFSCMLPKIDHNGFELERIFDIKPVWLRDCFSRQAWAHVAAGIRASNVTHEYARYSIAFHKYADSLGIKINMITDGYTRHTILPERETKYRMAEEVYNVPYLENSAYGHNVSAVDFAGHCYYAGCWISDIFFRLISDTICEEFTFPAFDERNQIIADDISSCSSVGVHVRRGSAREGRSVIPERYTRPVSIIKSTVKKPVFFIFSDDIEWCKANLENMSFNSSDEIVFVNENTAEQSFRDMQLMTYCKNLIRAPHSSFSYMADILNRNPHRISIGTKYFY